MLLTWSIKIYCFWLRYFKSISFYNYYFIYKHRRCVLVMESHFKSFSTKTTSKSQSGNIFPSCFQKSTKNLMSQNIVVHDVLGKRKIPYNQIQKGCRNIGVLDQLEKKSKSVFGVICDKEKLTSEEAMKVLKFDHSVSEKNEEFLNRFLQKCWECKFQQFWLFVTASKQRWFQINCQGGQFKWHFCSRLCIHYSIAIAQYLQGFWSCFIVIAEQFYIFKVIHLCIKKRINVMVFSSSCTSNCSLIWSIYIGHYLFFVT